MAVYGQWGRGGVRAQAGVFGQSDPVATINMPTHTSTENPVATHGEIQDSPGNLSTRRALLVGLAALRARNLAPGQQLGAASQHRLAQLHGAEAPDIQGLSQQNFEGLLKLLTSNRRRPSSGRYNPLFLG